MKLSDLVVDKVRFVLPVWSNGEILGEIEFYNPTKALSDEIERKILSGEEISDEYKMTVLLENLTNLTVDITTSDLMNGYFSEILDRILIEIDQIIMDISANVLLRLTAFDNMSEERKEAISHMADGLSKEQIEEYIGNTKKQIEIEEENFKYNE